MVPRSSCLHCRFLRLASGELQSPTGTGCPFLAGRGLQLWLCLLLPAVMVTRAQCTGVHCCTSPACSGPSSGAAQSHSSRQVVVVVLRVLTSEVVSSIVTKSILSPGPSWWFWFPISIHLQLLAPLKPKLPSPWRKVLLKVCQHPVTCSSHQSTGSFLSYSAEGVEYWQQWKNQLLHNFFYFNLMELAVNQDSIYFIRSKVLQKELTTRSSYNVKLPQSRPS